MVCRKHKDPLKPKHPIFAFLVYANERRAAFREENKNVLEINLEKLEPIDMKKTIIHTIAIFPNVSIHGVIYTY